jgi:hypothetical protein
MPVTLPDAARAVPGHFRAAVPTEPAFERSGYQRSGETDARIVADLRDALEPLLEPGGTVFDFANGPGLFHYLLDVPPSTRYYHVSLAMRQRTQGDLIRRLESDRPAVVVFTSDGVLRSQFSLDGVANQVRYYDVSRYLLDTYVPVAEAHGFVLMRRRGEGAHGQRALYFRAPSCDWGYAPNFYAPEPDRGAASLSLPVRPLEPGRVWAVTLPRHGSRYRWLEVETAKPLGEGRFLLSDRADVGDASKRSIAFKSLSRGWTALSVLVGACSQWHAYEPGTVYLRSDVPQQIRAVRLFVH